MIGKHVKLYILKYFISRSRSFILDSLIITICPTNTNSVARNRFLVVACKSEFIFEIDHVIINN